ncbi:hypothetical protein FAGKG844_360028 [Frankia sp. AgKG'84/4]
MRRWKRQSPVPWMGVRGSDLSQPCVRSATHPKHPQPILPMMLRIAHIFTLGATGHGAADAPTDR